MGFQPTGDRVLVKREKAEEKSEGGIIFPESAQEKSATAIVVAVGRRVPLVKKGDRVYLAKWQGTEVELDGEQHLVLKEEDILGVFENGDVKPTNAGSLLRRLKAQVEKESRPAKAKRGKAKRR